MAKAVIHTAEEIIRIRRAAQATAQARDRIAAAIEPGMSTAQLDDIAAACIAETGGTSAFLGYCGFPGNICISLNEVVVHGIGSPDRIIKDGDIVSIDVGAYIDGFHGDCAATFIAGEVSDEVKKLIEVTRQSFFEGIKFARAGYRVGDISHAIQEYVEAHGFSVVREFVGHGIGSKLHEEPEVPNYGTVGHGPRLIPGITIAVEPMVNMGTAAVKVLSDGWTVETMDGKPSAHYENTILITKGEPEILTPLDGDGYYGK